MSLKKEVGELLGKGASLIVVAETLGIDVPTLLDMQQDPEVRMYIQKKASERLTNALDMDEFASEVEQKALIRLSSAIDRETDARKLAAIYQVMNKSSKRVVKPEEKGLQGGGDTVVNLVLPSSHVERRRPAAPTYEVDAMGQVTSVDGRQLQTMDATKVKQLAVKTNDRLATMLEQAKEPQHVRLEDL